MSEKLPNKTAKRKKTLKINTPERWEAISSGVRFEIITFLSACGPCSIAELAEHMLVRADGLYHHIRRLLNAEMIQEVGYEKVGRQSQVIYDLAADHYLFDVYSKKAIASNIERLEKLNSAIFRRSERLFADALESGKLSFNDETRNAFLRSDTARLTEPERQRAIELMTELTGLFENARKNRDGDLYFLTLQFSPLIRESETKET